MINHKTETYFQKLKLILSTNSAKAVQMDFAAIINKAKLCKKIIKTITLNLKMVMSFLTINLLKSTKKGNLLYNLIPSI